VASAFIILGLVGSARFAAGAPVTVVVGAERRSAEATRREVGVSMETR